MAGIIMSGCNRARVVRRAVTCAAVVAATACAWAARAAPPAIPDLETLTAEQIEADYTAGKYTAADLTQAYLNQISTYSSVYNAFISLNPTALQDAAALDAKRSQPGFVPGPLFGVPIAIKDSMDVKGIPTTGGSSALSSKTGGIDIIPDKDAPLVARLRDAGAIILGKTNIPDWSIDGNRSNSSVLGKTHNAYNYSRTPGGSSGGSAVATATGMSALAMGEETGSSITNPSSANSIVGIRPTFGLVPSTGIMPGQGTFRDVMGPLAKTVKDAAHMLDVIAGPTPADPKTAAAQGHVPAAGYAAALNPHALQGARIGVYGAGYNNVTLSAETQQLFTQELSVLTARGATLVADPFANSGFFQLTQGVPSSNTYTYDVNQYFGRMGPGATVHSTEEFKTLTGKDFYSLPLNRAPSSPDDPATRSDLDAYRTRRDQMLALFQKVLDDNNLDALVMPQLAAPVPLLESTDAIQRTPGSAVNIMGVPGVVVPGGYYSDATPFAMYFIGRQWDESTLIGLGYDYEQATLHRVEPTLVPEPGSAAISLVFAAPALLLRRRRRAA
ncbi:MAG: Amidase [Phycisphaerales bacterium]|nr:Amidase [Phycisphaerales bacterium]